MSITIIQRVSLVLKVEGKERNNGRIIDRLLSSLVWFFIATIKKLHSIGGLRGFTGLIQHYLSRIDIISEQSASMHQLNAALLDY